MSYFSEWNEKIEDTKNQQAYQDFVARYYETEQHAYDLILQGYPNFALKGTAAELAEKLDYAGDMVLFLGFLDGINQSLTEAVDLDTVEDTTPLDLEINYETLLYNMHDAKAEWLYKLDSWDNVFTREERDEIGKRFRKDHIAVSDKIGRNDPCPCGSGLKYKKCHGKNA